MLAESRVLAQAGPFVVQGLKASDLEDRVYRMLTRRLHWLDEQIDFQVDVLGGRLPGGQVLDFVLRAFGRTSVVDVRGDYWHNRTLQLRERDREKQAAVEQAWGRPLHYVPLNSGDLRDDETAYVRLLREVGRGG